VLKPDNDFFLNLLSTGESYVDVDLGNTPFTFAKSLWYQLTGELPTESQLEQWIQFQKSPIGKRRIDLAVSMASSFGKSPRYIYSDPWQMQQEAGRYQQKKVKRALGAVLMYFFNCPKDTVNSKPAWANNHVPGMTEASTLLGFGTEKKGFYNAKENPGFWVRELLDGRSAGLDYFLLNANGPDDYASSLTNLAKAYEALDAQGETSLPGIGLFDDTWAWGKKHVKGTPWEEAPDCSEPEAAAEKIFTYKWSPIFEVIPEKHWFRFKGKPVIGFYNAGTIKNREHSSEVVTRIKGKFKKRFGVEPMLLIDSAYFVDKKMAQVADAMFKWNTFRLEGGISRDLGTLSYVHAMPRWDSVSRDSGSVERAAKESDRIVKDDELLIKILNETISDDMVTLGTWNDLGEGTGVNRSYDYWWDGRWHSPDHFLKLMQRSQAGEVLK
jgi:hypothetical protein